MDQHVVIAGVDTHKDTHHAAVITATGQHLGAAECPTTPAGHRALAAFIAGFGTLVKVGVEGTGSYGAGLTRYLTGAGVTVIEVLRPSRQVRRMRGKSDEIDAYAAAETALAGTNCSVPKDRNGRVEAIRGSPQLAGQPWPRPRTRPCRSGTSWSPRPMRSGRNIVPCTGNP